MSNLCSGTMISKSVVFYVTVKSLCSFLRRFSFFRPFLLQCQKDCKKMLQFISLLFLDEMESSLQRPLPLLPTEVNLRIFEHVLDKQAWKVLDLSRINKKIRSSLSPFQFSNIHLHSQHQLSALIDAHKKTLSGSRQHTVFYLHHLLGADSYDEFHAKLSLHLSKIPINARNQMDTLGIRLLPCLVPLAPLGLWTCSVMPKLKRLYVDATLHPPMGEDEPAYEYIMRVSKMDLTLGTNFFDEK